MKPSAAQLNSLLHSKKRGATQGICAVVIGYCNATFLLTRMCDSSGPMTVREFWQSEQDGHPIPDDCVLGWRTRRIGVVSKEAPQGLHAHAVGPGVKPVCLEVNEITVAAHVRSLCYSSLIGTCSTTLSLTM